jgi:GH43 family beta-xylosidase
MAGQPHRQISDFQNPVYAVSFPDPFVLEHDGLYYAYATGDAGEGRVFAAAVSEDLVAWRPLGGVMPRLDRDSPHYWAPEVVYDNGRFYLYYSVGNEEWMELRVAIAKRAEGPFEDQGLKLTGEQFAIDAHVLKDDDGTWYMFYATDFLDHEFIGTGVVVDRMLDPLTLEGKPRPAALARYDWQVYDPKRKEKGGVRWHTVEGPSVVKRKGRYFMTFSGGNWQNDSYGVGFAVSERLDGPEEWKQSCDGTSNLPILRSIPERILGPGHNSITHAPNGRELICVYHEWQDNERKMAIDRMEIVADRVVIFGPTDSPEPVPYQSQRIDELGRWKAGCGCWSETENGLAAGADSRAEIEFSPDSPSFLFRTGLRIGQGSGSAGVKLRTAAGDEFEAMITVENGEARIRCTGTESGTCESLLSKFRRNAVYQYRIEADERCVTAYLDDRRIGSHVLPDSASSIVLAADGPEAIFSANRITYGFEEFFVDGSVEERGWERSGDWSLEDQNLIARGGNASLRKPLGLGGDFELSVNLRCRDAESGAKFRIADVTVLHDDRWRLLSGETSHDLAASGLEQFRQVRLVSRGGGVELFVDEKSFGQMPSAAEHRIIEVAASSGAWELDMVRCTFI